MIAKASDSALSKQLVKLWPIFNRYQHWSIGDGLNVDAWNSSWIGENFRIEDRVESVPSHLQTAKVAELVSVDGSLNEECIDWLPYEVQNRISECRIRG